MTVVAFTKVKLEHGWLGNMAPFPILHYDVEWRTNEHLFQALRFDSQIVRTAIRLESSPMAAKMTAKRWAKTTPMIVDPRSPLDVENMRRVLHLKLEQHPTLQGKLKATGDAFIVEDVTARPASESNDFWGARLVASVWCGENTLGKLWMELRAEISLNQAARSA